MTPPPSAAPQTPGLPPRVLLVSSTLDDDGGIPVCVAQLAEGLAGLGAAVEIAGQHASRPAAVVADVVARGQATLSAIAAPWHPAGQWRAARRMRGIVAASAARAAAEGRRLVVHLHGVWVAPVQAAAAAATAAGATLVVSPHGMLRREALRKSRWRKRLVWHASLRRLLLHADTLHVTSPAEMEDLVALLPGCSPALLPLGVRPPAAAPRVRVAGAPRRAGYLGRLLPIKNLDGLLEAWKAAAPAGWRLSIDGPSAGQEGARLAALADRLGIAAAERPVAEEVALPAAGGEALERVEEDVEALAPDQLPGGHDAQRPRRRIRRRGQRGDGDVVAEGRQPPGRESHRLEEPPPHAPHGEHQGEAVAVAPHEEPAAEDLERAREGAELRRLRHDSQPGRRGHEPAEGTPHDGVGEKPTEEVERVGAVVGHEPPEAGRGGDIDDRHPLVHHRRPALGEAILRQRPLRGQDHLPGVTRLEDLEEVALMGADDRLPEHQPSDPGTAAAHDGTVGAPAARPPSAAASRATHEAQSRPRACSRPRATHRARAAGSARSSSTASTTSAGRSSST